jgi:hypothetical protein
MYILAQHSSSAPHAFIAENGWMVGYLQHHPPIF